LRKQVSARRLLVPGDVEENHDHHSREGDPYAGLTGELAHARTIGMFQYRIVYHEAVAISAISTFLNRRMMRRLADQSILNVPPAGTLAVFS
jgi:hypothetical protein